MDKKKAIEIIRLTSDYISGMDESGEIAKAMQMAIDALEKEANND